MSTEVEARAHCPAIAIVGPTAVGKSEVADLVAAALSTEVISADAMQVYRGMDIGTAKMPLARRCAPLRAIDIVDPGEPYSAALYQHDARRHIERLLAARMTPVICGGTGLYVRAALDDLSFPSGDATSPDRLRYKALFAREGATAVYELLAERDPRSAAVIHPHNVRRAVRALEMLDQGVSYAEQRTRLARIEPFYETRYIGLTMERETLYRRIELRVEDMIGEGFVEEVRRLVSAGAADALTSRQAIGYNEIVRVLNGEMTLISAIEFIKMRTRRYAKRQMSWFGRDPRIEWIRADEMTAFEAADVIIQRVRR